MTKEGFVPPKKEEESNDLERLISDIESGTSELSADDQVRQLKGAKDRLKGSFRNPKVKRQIDLIDRLLLKKEAEIEKGAKAELEFSGEPESLEPALEEREEELASGDDAELPKEKEEQKEEFLDSANPFEEADEKGVAPAEEVPKVEPSKESKEEVSPESEAESSTERKKESERTEPESSIIEEPEPGEEKEKAPEEEAEDELAEIRNKIQAKEEFEYDGFTYTYSEMASDDTTTKWKKSKGGTSLGFVNENDLIKSFEMPSEKKEEAEKEMSLEEKRKEYFKEWLNELSEDELLEQLEYARNVINSHESFLESADPENEADQIENSKRELESVREQLLIIKEVAEEKGFEIPKPLEKKKGIIDHFRESIVWKKLKGEQVTTEEMEQLSKKEKTALIAGKVADIASSSLGIRIITRMPDRWLKRYYSKKEIKRIIAIFKEEEKLNQELAQEDTTEERRAEIRSRLQELGLSEEDSRYNRVSQRISEIEKSLEDSKYLSEEKRTQLRGKLSAIKDKWATDEELIESDMSKEVEKVFNQYVGERTKKTDLVKDTVNLVSVSLGAYAIRSVGYGAIALYNRHKRLKKEKGEGEEVSFFKETVWQGAVETAQEMFGQGKLKELKGKKKAIAVGATWAKGALPLAIAMMGYSEVAEKGSGAFTHALARAQERAGEIGESWEKVSQAGGLAKGSEVAKAIIDTLNLQESAQRLTHGLFSKKETVTSTSLEETPETATNVDHVAGTEETPAGISQVSPSEATEMPSGIGKVGIDKVDEMRMGAETADTTDIGVNRTLAELGVTDSTAQAELAVKFAGNQEILSRANQTFEAAGLTPEQSAEIIKGAASVESLKETMDQISAETAMGVNSIDGGISQEELNSVVSQLRGPNSETANSLLDTWEAEGTVPADQINELRDQVALEEALGVDSFEGGVSKEELNKVISGLAAKDREQADALLANWQERGLVDANEVTQLRFPVENASLEHAGFQTEVVDGKVNISLDLGKEGAPKYLEQVYDRIAIENTDLGDNITNVEGAQILNVGANLRELSEGHSVDGISVEDFQKYVSAEDGKLAISDYEGFKANILDKLTEHSQEIITGKNVADSGAVAYLDNIKKATWGDMVKPEGITEEGIQFDQKMIDQAEGRLFQATLDHSGKGELITDVKFANEDTGTFHIFGESVSVRDGHVISIGDTPIEHPFALGNEAGGDRLIDEAARVRAQGLISSMEPREINTFAQEYDISKDLDDTLDNFGFGKGQGAEEWEFLRNQPTEDLLNKNIEGHAGRVNDWLERHHRGKVSKFIQEAIDNGKIKSPAEGGPKTVEESMEAILRAQAKEQMAADLSTAETIVASSEKISQEGARSLETLEQDISKLVTVGDNGKGTLSLTLEQIRSDEGGELLKSAIETDGGNVDRADEIRREVLNTINNTEGVDNKQTLARFLEHHSQDESVKSAATGFRAEAATVEAATVEPPPENPATEATTIEETPQETTMGTRAEEADVIPEGERLNSFTTPDGNSVNFQYGDDGKIIGIETDGYVPGFSHESLKDDYRDTVYNTLRGSNEKLNVKEILDIERAKETVKTLGHTIDLDRNILHSMEKAGKGDTPEAVFLRKEIEDSINKIESRYGDVFKDAPDNGIGSTTVEEGIKSSSETVSEAAPIPEGLGGEATPGEINLALGNLTSEIGGIDKLTLEDINNLDDADTLTKLKDGTEEVLRQIKENPPKEANSDSLQAITRGYQHILGAIDSRLKEI